MEYVIVPASGSLAELVAMVVPVATFSAKLSAARVEVRLGASLISVSYTHLTLPTILLV